jgi:probable selenium-dependent hydroxylase accessory protein YqeC
MSLKRDLLLESGQMVALIGAGGKTTTLFRLAKELRDEGAKVMVTTTTKIFKPTKPHVDRLFLVQDIDAFREQAAKITAPTIIGAGYSVDDEEKLLGLPSAWLDQLQQSGQFDSMLVEADGAASRLFKVPSEIEPVVPNSCTVVIWVMAIKALGKPLNSDSVHRAERAIALLGAAPDTQLTKQHVLQLVKHPLGCLKGIPTHCRKIALLNQADSPNEIETAKELARDLMQLGFDRVLITSYVSDNPVKAVTAN